MALDIFMQRKSEIFIVVLDILMPDTDGRKLAVKIKAIDPDIPVILFSQYGYKGKSTEWGVEGIDFVMKNDGNKLITLIKRYEQQ